MQNVLLHLRARPRLTLSLAVGVAAAILLPGEHRVVTRFLLGWNVAVWLYLTLVGVMMARADHDRLRRTALAQAEGARTVLAAVVLAALCSVVGIVAELAVAKAPGVPHAASHVLFALATVVGAWLLLPTMFALTYASHYYRTSKGEGLQFACNPKADIKTDPKTDATGLPPTPPPPDYGDFLYFAFTIAVASQTSDVSVTTRSMRRLVLIQSVLSFAFNTFVLALTINIAAGLF